MTAAIAASPVLAEVLDAIETGMFSPDDRGRYRELVDSLRHHDYFMVTADFDAYWNAQRSLNTLWQDREAWCAQGDPQHRAHGLVLGGSRHPRIRARDLGRRARASCSRAPHAHRADPRPTSRSE